MNRARDSSLIIAEYSSFKPSDKPRRLVKHKTIHKKYTKEKAYDHIPSDTKFDRLAYWDLEAKVRGDAVAEEENPNETAGTSEGYLSRLPGSPL